MKQFKLSLLLLSGCVFICVHSKRHYEDSDVVSDPFRKQSFVPFINRLKQQLFHHGRKPSTGPPKRIDLLIAFQGTNCHQGYQYKQVIAFIKKMIDHFSVSPGTTRIGLIKFVRYAKTIIPFGKCKNSEAVQHYLTKESHMSPSTASEVSIVEALEKAIHEFKKFTRPRTKRILLVFTADKRSKTVSKRKFNAALNQLKKMKVERHVIAIKEEFSHHLSRIARALVAKNNFHRVSGALMKKYISQLSKGLYKRCNRHKTVVYDECHRRCKCVNGRMTNCHRVRKEWNSLTKVQRQRYIDTYLTLTTHTSHKSRYEKFVNSHEINFEGGIHTKDNFLPWHRWFNTAFENLLKEIDCRVTVPYWDWSMVSNDPWNENGLFGPQSYGFGTVHTEPGTNCVLNGPFAKSKWKLTNNQCLQRKPNMTESPPDAADVELILRFKHFEDYEEGLRETLHDTVHCVVGGTMCEYRSASSPEFFLHHAFVDKLWSDAQKKSTAFYYGFWKQSNSIMPKAPYSGFQMLHLKRQPGFIKIMYAQTRINHAKEVQRALAGKSTKSVQKLPRRPTTTVSEAALKLFNASERERRKAYKIDRYLSKHQIVRHDYSKETGLTNTLLY